MSAKGTPARKAQRSRNNARRARRDTIAEDLSDIRLDIKADDIAIKTSGELDVPIVEPKAPPVKKKGKPKPASNWADYPENENTGRYVGIPPNDGDSDIEHAGWRHRVLTEAGERSNATALDKLLEGPSARGAGESYRWR